MKNLIFSCFIYLFSLSSIAAPITYQLHDVVFDDGGTASGSFDWSPSDGGSNISITTTAGQSRNYDVTYTTQQLAPALGTYFLFSLVGDGGNEANYWVVSFDAAGPFEGAFYLSTPKPDYYNALAERDTSDSYKRNIVSGYASPVPIPTASWLFGTSLIALLFRGRNA